MKIPKIRRLDSGTYFCQLRLNGQSISVTGRTEAECANNAILIKAKHKTGEKKIVKEKNEKTLDEIINAYIDKYESVLSPSTIRGYESIRKNRFKKYMNKPVSKIDWQEMINDELLTKGEHTVKNGFGLVTAALKDAKHSVPVVKLAKIPVNELPFLDADELVKFVQAAEGDKAEIEMLLEAHGLRESECMYVVRNNGIDLKHNIIHVNGAYVPNKDHKYVEKSTNKTYKSTRDVPIMIPRLATLVKEHQDEGKSIKTHSASALLSHVNKCCERAGVTVVGNHGLRRSLASLAYSKGIPEIQVMAWCGWSDYATMHKFYVKLSARDAEKNKNAVTDFFSSITASQ
jgi:integrase